MKNNYRKISLYFSIICNVSIVLCFIIGSLMFFNYDKTSRIEKNEFVSYMNNKGCSVIDIQEKEKYSGFETYLVTDKNTCPYLISYATFTDKNTLNDFFIKGKNDVLSGNNNVKGKTKISINLFSEYYEYSTSGDYYKKIVYNDNSVLYATASKDYRNEIINIFNDLNYKYEFNLNGMTIMWCSLFIVIIIVLVSMWGIEKKIRNKGWIALIPIYNIGCLSKDILGSFWFFLLSFIPGVNVIFLFILLYNLGKSFGKSNSYCILMMFFPTVLCPFLAFDNSSYKKTEKKVTEIDNSKSIHNKTVVIKKEKPKEQITLSKKVNNTIKWILTLIILLLSVIILVSYFEEKLIGYMVLAIMLLIYALLLCPSITRYTRKYKRYTKFKPLLIILLLILNFILFAILPF